MTPHEPLDRRTLLAVSSAAVAGAALPETTPTRAATTPGTNRRIDAYTHFTPVKYLDFAEKEEGKPYPLRRLLEHIPTIVDAEARLDLLNRNQVDIHVLVPVPWIESFPRVAADPTLAKAAARLVNDEVAALIAAQPTRFRGVAILPSVDPEAMIAELNRAVKDLGFVGAYLPVGPTVKRMDHPDYELLFKTLTELDVTLWLHPSRAPLYPDYADETMSRFLEWQTIGWLHDTTSAMYRIVFSGVFDRYPTIRIVTHHHGAFVPLHAPRLDASWALFEQGGIALPTRISKPYIDHFRKFYCDTAVFGFAPKVLEIALDFFGPERILFGSDSPFDITGGQYFTTETLRSIEAMTIAPKVRNSILSANAARILKIG